MGSSSQGIWNWLWHFEFKHRHHQQKLQPAQAWSCERFKAECWNFWRSKFSHILHRKTGKPENQIRWEGKGREGVLWNLVSTMSGMLVDCGGCRTPLVLPPGAPSIRCALCGYVTLIATSRGNISAVAPVNTPPPYGSHAPSAPQYTPTVSHVSKWWSTRNKVPDHHYSWPLPPGSEGFLITNDPCFHSVFLYYWGRVCKIWNFVFHLQFKVVCVCETNSLLMHMARRRHSSLESTTSTHATSWKGVSTMQTAWSSCSHRSSTFRRPAFLCLQVGVTSTRRVVTHWQILVSRI